MTRFAALAAALLVTAAAPAAAGQGDGSDSTSAAALYADTVLVWRTYADDASARVRMLASSDEDRPYTVVVDQLPGQAGLVTDDARFVAETVARAFGYDPVQATFVFRFTGESFQGPGGDDLALLVRATFRRGKSGSLGSPSWRVINRDELAELTDRALY